MVGLSVKISLFQRIHIIYDGFSREKIGIVKFNIVLKIYAKNTWKYVIFFFTKLKELFSLKQTIFMNIIGASNSFFDVLLR